MSDERLTHIVNFRTTPSIAASWEAAVAASGATNKSDWLRQQISVQSRYKIDEAGLPELLIARAKYQGEKEIADWIQKNMDGRARETGIVRRLKRNQETESKPISYDPKIRRQLAGATNNLNQLAYSVNAAPYLATCHAESIVAALGEVEIALNRVSKAIRSIEDSEADHDS